MVRGNAVRALAALLLLGSATVPALAQNYEYSASHQGNLAQVRVTPSLHANLEAYVAQWTAAQNVSIAILDGLADANHQDLAGRTTAQIVYGGSYTAGDDHGTHVAGIAGASRNGAGIVGIAPTAKLLSIPVFDDYSWVAWDNGRAAFNTARSLGAKVVNMSYGSTQRGQVFIPGEIEVIDDYLSSMVMVRAAGNAGTTLGSIAYSGNASTGLANLLIVGSVNSQGGISSFSNRPGESCFTRRSGRRTVCTAQLKEFFIVAPGERVLSDMPNGGYAYMSGTSMASPTVAGAAALVFQDAYNGNAFLTPAQVANILKRSARDLGRRGVDSTYGWGLLDVAAALGPVGPTTVATGSTVGKKSVTASSSVLAPSAGMMNTQSVENLLSGMVVFDDYGRGFVMNEVGLSASRSTLADDAASAALAAVTTSRETVTETDGLRLSLVETGAAGETGFSGLSFATDEFTVSAGLGNAQAFFTQPGDAGAESAARTLGTHFFTGAGEIGQGFAQGGYLSAETSAAGLTYSALFMHGSEALFDTAHDPLAAGEEDKSGSQLMMLGAEMALPQAGSLGLHYGVLRETGTLLGIQNEGAFALGEDAYTQFVGLSLAADLMPGVTLEGFAQLGLTEATQAQDTIFSALSDVWSSKMGLSLTADGMLQPGDSVSLSLVSPWRIVDGDATAQVAVGREFDGTVIYETRKASLETDALPLDLGLSYTGGTGDFRYSASVWLRDHDAGGGPDVNEAAGALGFSWKF